MLRLLFCAPSKTSRKMAKIVRELFLCPGQGKSQEKSGNFFHVFGANPI